MQSTNDPYSLIADERLLNNHFTRILASKNIASLSKLEIVNLTLIAKCGDIAMCYAPLAHMNFTSSVVLVGLTPGWSQMNIALMECIQRLQVSDLHSGMDVHRGHIASYFAGRMRVNLVNMLDEIGLNGYLGIQSVSSLFAEDRRLMHATSILRYPVFNKSHNYTGHGPRPESNPLLAQVVDTLFLQEILCFHGCVIIPFGKIASSCVARISNLRECFQIVNGLPHPSPANGHRLKQFHDGRENLRSQVRMLS